jgi:ribonuclease HI
MGVGLVCRDHNRKVRGTICIYIPYVTDPTVAEALAAQHGVEFCSELPFTKILLEGDARATVLAIQKLETTPSTYRSIIEDTRERLKSLQEWAVMHVWREGNHVAHFLARR